MKYLDTPITCIAVSRDGFIFRVQFTFKMMIESLFLTSSDKSIHSLIEDCKKKIEILSSSRIYSLNFLCITQIIP